MSDWEDRLASARERGVPASKQPVKEPSEPVVVPGSARGEIAAALESALSPAQLGLLMDEVLAITKSAPADIKCKSCGQQQRHMVQVPDARAVTSAIVELANQAWGRPGPADDGRADEERIAFTRTVIFEGDNPDAPPA